MKKKLESLQGWLLITPLLIGCLLFYAIPFVLVVQYSLSTGSGGSSDFIGFINYQDVTTNGMFTLAFGNTMRFLAAALPLIMVLAYAIALLMQKHTNSMLWISVGLAAATGIGFLQPLVLQEITDKGMMAQDLQVLGRAVTVLALLVLLNQAVEMAQTRLFVNIHNKTYYRVRRNRNVCRILCLVLAFLLVATTLGGCMLYKELRLPQLGKFKQDVYKDYPDTSVSCKYDYGAGVDITVTGPDFDDESAFTILSRLRAVVSDEAFIKDLFELFEKESHDDPNWKNGRRPEIWLHLTSNSKDRYQFTAGANKEIYNSGRSPNSYTWDGYKTWYGTEIKEGEYRDITSEEVEEAIKKFS